MKKRMKTLLPAGIATKIAYVGSKLSTCFRVKDVTEFNKTMTYSTKTDVPKMVVMNIT